MSDESPPREPTPPGSITVGNLSNVTGAAIGTNAQANVSQGGMDLGEHSSQREFSKTERRQFVSMLFSDIRGFSEIKDDSLSVKVAQFNDDFKGQFLNSGNHFFSKTWGDAFFICSEDPYDLAEISLNLRDRFRTTNWGRLGFQAPLAARIGLHLEQVSVLIEHGTVVDVMGTQVNSTARIEPIVEPNQVFCSDIFYKHLANEPHSVIIGLPLGRRSLAKSFGEMELYRLVWDHEAS